MQKFSVREIIVYILLGGIAWVLTLAALAFGIYWYYEGGDTDDPTLDEIINAGYHLYVLPDEKLEELGWTQEIKMISLKHHCKGNYEGYTINPVQVFFTDSQDNSVLNLRILPADPYFSPFEDTKIFNTDAEWVPSKDGKYHRKVTGIFWLELKDTYDMDVVLTSDLEIDELMQIVEALEYKGENHDTDRNPWIAVCQ